MSSAAIRRHWQRVVENGCIIDGRPAEIAHAHGPSLTARGFLKPKGKKQAWQDWLVLPLCPECHRLHADSFDNNLAGWEKTHGTAADWLDVMGAFLDLDLWALAHNEMKP